MRSRATLAKGKRRKYFKDFLSGLDGRAATADDGAAEHPLDQFHAFKALYDGGLNEEDIAARHFVSPDPPDDGFFSA